jgi:hypothetical protein
MLQEYINRQWWLFIIICIFIARWIPLHPVFGQTIGELSPQDVNAIIPEIEAAEKSIHNLKIDEESWVEERSSVSDTWKRTPTYLSCTAWMDGKPKGKIKADVHKKNQKWLDGAAPYLEHSYSVSFDGTNTKSIENTTGHSGKTWPKMEGEISSGLSENKIMYSWIGWQFTTNFFFSNDEKGNTFSRLFRAAISKEALAAKAFEIAYEEKGGILCLKFGSRPTKRGSQAWWFDPERGFALIAYLRTSIDGNGVEHIMSDIKVNKLKEVAKGVWWPMEATIESEIRDPILLRDPNAPYKRTVYRALNVVANDPNFDESVFAMTFPEGYRIDDKVTGKTYVVDANSK